MGDYQCRSCSDRGDCRMCSWFFQPDDVHARCGRKWREHPLFNHVRADCPASDAVPSGEATDGTTPTKEA